MKKELAVVSKISIAIWEYGKLWLSVKKQEGYLDKVLKPVIAPYFDKNDGSLSQKDYHKIMRYYAWGVPVFLGKIFSIIHSKNISPSDYETLTYLGGITGLADDFFDESELSEVKIYQLLTNPQQITAKNSSEALFLKLYLSALENSNAAEGIQKRMKEIFTVQKASLRQENKSTSYDELIDICYDKGAVSVLFFQSALGIEPSPKEEVFYKNLGGLIQLGNDIFDIYKDQLKGIRTPANCCQKIADLQNLYTLWERNMVESILQIPISKKQKDKLLHFILFGFSRVHVCLIQLSKLSNNELFKAENYKRSQLICDMEKPSNLLLSLKIFSKQAY